jgi:hypothetical protein
MYVIRRLVLFVAVIAIAAVLWLMVPSLAGRALVVGLLAGGGCVCVTLGLCFLLGLLRWHE